jgi:hypothetical protein
MRGGPRGRHRRPRGSDRQAYGTWVAVISRFSKVALSFAPENQGVIPQGRQVHDAARRLDSTSDPQIAGAL